MNGVQNKQSTGGGKRKGNDDCRFSIGDCGIPVAGADGICDCRTACLEKPGQLLKRLQAGGSMKSMKERGKNSSP